ncbi:MAG: hypothetical protein ACI4EF_06130 [Coprococcus sp.]
MTCTQCQSNEYYAKPSGKRIGIYCANCDGWIRWIKYSDYLKIYADKLNEPMKDNEALKKIYKSPRRIVTMHCSECGCPLYDSSKPPVKFRFNLVNAKFCPKCGRKFIL